MKLTCNTIMEAPLMNMIRLYDSLHVVGVCGILTAQTQNVPGTTISALALLTYCNDLTVAAELTSDLTLVDITLPEGAITYQSIAEASNGYLTKPTGLTDSGIIMSTAPVSFKLVVGATTPAAPLTTGRVSEYILSLKLTGLEFTSLPLPLLTKKVISFKVTSDNGFSIIETVDVPDSILNQLVSQVTKS